MSNRSSISLDAYFNEQLDSVAGCVLPVIVKEKICKVLHSFCFGSGLSVNLDIHSINFLPDEFKSTFALIMNHLYSVDSQAEKLVLDVIKLISQFAPTPHIPVSPLPQSRPATHRATGSQEFNALPSSEDLNANNNFDLSEMRDVHDAEEIPPHDVFCSQYDLHKSVHLSRQVNSISQHSCAESKETGADDAEASLPLPVPKLNLSASKSPLNLSNDSVARVMKKLSRNNVSSQSPSYSTPSRFKTPLSGIQSNSLKRRLDSQGKSDLQHHCEYNGSHLQDCTNAMPVKRINKSVDNLYVPDSISPSPKPRISRFHSQKLAHISCYMSLNIFFLIFFVMLFHFSEDTVYLYGVRCTFWALGESLKPGGVVKSYVISVFCYSLYQKPNGHPDVSKRHYLFPNIAENLLKDPDEIDQAILARAFQRSSKARPLHQSNMVDNIFPPFAFNVISTSFPFKL
ncbi:hypothetical protein HU200_030451 [Digitaria exilis]|uniref:Uncharacterized protein n=1 Tax=Digitaria exilis TaxID=1010633 RepID=A0A835C0I1_9POAL|nr:hypothetical protein HU200_030451 [Digitaria exilis]